MTDTTTILNTIDLPALVETDAEVLVDGMLLVGATAYTDGTVCAEWHHPADENGDRDYSTWSEAGAWLVATVA